MPQVNLQRAFGSRLRAHGWNPVVEKITPSGGTTATVRYVWGTVSAALRRVKKELCGTMQSAPSPQGYAASSGGAPAVVLRPVAPCVATAPSPSWWEWLFL